MRPANAYEVQRDMERRALVTLAGTVWERVFADTIAERDRLRALLEAVEWSHSRGGDEYGPVPGSICAALGTYYAALDAARKGGA